jgi:hypothetical protein
LARIKGLSLAEAAAAVPSTVVTTSSKASSKARFQDVFRLTGELLVPVLKVSVVLCCLFTAFGSLFLGWFSVSLQQGEATAEEFLLLLGGFSCSEICYMAAVTANTTAL